LQCASVIAEVWALDEMAQKKKKIVLILKSKIRLTAKCKK
jgi:hypothetical protein